MPKCYNSTASAGTSPVRRIEINLESLGYGRSPIADRREVEGKI
jgi:hypothetical protein